MKSDEQYEVAVLASEFTRVQGERDAANARIERLEDALAQELRAIIADKGISHAQSHNCDLCIRQRRIDAALAGSHLDDAQRQCDQTRPCAVCAGVER